MSKNSRDPVTSFLMKGLSHFASESVCAGHPDKICDQISDAILDEVLKKDLDCHVQVETMAGKDMLVLSGEIKTSAQKIDFEKIARAQIKRLGYTEPAWGFSDQSPIKINIHEQSPEIAVAVDHKGAGDQGMMFGFACLETPELMPLPIMLAHLLVRNIDMARQSGRLNYLRPDGKSQVVVRYKDGKPVGVEHVTLAVPHDESVDNEQLRNDCYNKVITPALESYGLVVAKSSVVVNGTGVWHHPGPAQDTGLTGRKINVDSYGGYARVGGGSFSGKDATKVDRSGAYAARFIAKNIVAAGLAKKCEVGLAYYIGGRQPVMMEIDTFETRKYSQKALHDFADKIIDTSVQGIIEGLDLRRPIYLPTAVYGHFGKPDLPWEQIVELL
ncbi:MAG: S-adenosylmethionine synthase [Candidatus Saccharibacteria bacterium GW2011_GWA2_46_10]|nr:MAG: S-adenosylmethionine synthase [Candidatus Saccharibacteria bacterium GW2011_GWA2_46_10]